MMDLFGADSNGCGRGWQTRLDYIGHSGTCPFVPDALALANAGFGIIQRFDDGGSPQVPRDVNDYLTFAKTFADCVSKAKGIKVFQVSQM